CGHAVLRLLVSLSEKFQMICSANAILHLSSLPLLHHSWFEKFSLSMLLAWQMLNKLSRLEKTSGFH
ncbi:hypothetical protein M514_22328, partial [Trichuris suis]